MQVYYNSGMCVYLLILNEMATVLYLPGENISKICFVVSSKNKSQFCDLCLVVLSKAIVFLLGSIYGLSKRRDNIYMTYYLPYFLE